MDQKRTRYLWLSFILMLLVIFILPFYSHHEYSLIKNTTSQLGAQHMPFSWIMNSTFVLLGFTSILSGWNFLAGYWFQKMILIVFGTALVMTAVFQNAPIDPLMEYSIREDKLHSLFANITGFSFSVFAISLALITRRRSHQIMAFVMSILAPILSILMFHELTNKWMGIWQRLIFILMFGWLLYTFSKYQLKTKDHE